MPIEQIIIGGRSFGKTTRLMAWLANAPEDKRILICPSKEHGRLILHRMMSAHTVEILTPNMNRRNLLSGTTKYIAIDELDYMDVHSFNWDELMRHHLFITGGVADFLFSPILRLAQIFPDKVTKLPFPHNRIAGTVLNQLNMEMGNERFERDFLSSSKPPHDPFTFEEIMERYNNPFGEDKDASKR